METAAIISFVLTDSSSFKRLNESEAISYGGFYQLIASGLANRAFSEQVSQILGNRFVFIAEHSYGFRQMDGLEHIIDVLMRTPFLRKYEAVGRYYQALRIQKFGGGDVERATRLLELVAENAPSRYRARAMQSLGASSFYKSDYKTALSHYREASRFASFISIYDPYASLGTQKMAAVINGLKGNHREAVAQLENLFGLAYAMRSFQPHVYYDYMNSLAVELCEVGRLEEAENVSRIVAASPYARAYPEWRETREDIELKRRRPSRTRVAFSARSPEFENLVHMPLLERGDSLSVEPTPGTQPASVVSLQEWKTKMPKYNADPQELTTPTQGTDKEKRARLAELEKLTVRQKLLRIMEMLADESVTDKQLLKALMVLEDLELMENQGS